MSDLISRQVAIDKFEPWLKVKGYSDGELNILNAVLYELRFLPSVQPDDYARGYNDAKREVALSGEYERAYQRGKEDAQQWIPCSERLPEKYGVYQITWTTSAYGKRLIGDLEYEITTEWDYENDRFKGEWLLPDYIKDHSVIKVIAWMPLPEPYGGEK